MPNIPEKVLRTGFSFLPNSLVFFTKRPIMWIGRFLLLALSKILSYVGATGQVGMISVLV